MEHLTLFAQLKGVPAARLQHEVGDKLRQVGLSAVGHRPVGGFSGGMKRRLSVAIAVIGDPKVLVLDECTTGMDPVNRRSCWRLIQVSYRHE